MMINSHAIASVTEANQNFSRIARMTEQYGEIVLFKNNRPKFLVIDLDQMNNRELSDDEKIDSVAKKLLQEYRPAFDELAK